MSSRSDPREKRPDSITEAEMQQILAGSKANVKSEGFLMNRSLDGGDLMGALRHASNMVSELRTGLLTPKYYFELYMAAFDELQRLEVYLLDEKHGKKMAELYELVQYAGNILPRLYLLVTVGSAYIRLKEAPAKDVLRDIVEMCRGVQHPTRGLFLRTYLSEATKDKLPDVGDEERRSGTVADSIEFVLQNFTEMNKLWVRMQWQVSAVHKVKREQERADLRLLVGKNIMRLSQLEGVDLAVYQSTVLPRLLEQIIGCRDVLAQQYLMECIIQAFPDEFHLRTLSELLSACARLQTGVDTKTILVSLIDRLASFSERGEPIPDDIDVFSIFSKQVGEVVDAQKDAMSLEDVLELQSSLLSLSVTVYKDNLENIDAVYRFCAGACEAAQGNEIRTPAVVKQLLKLLDAPLQQHKDVHVILALPQFGKLMSFLSWADRRRVSLNIVNAARSAFDPWSVATGGAAAAAAAAGGGENEVSGPLATLRGQYITTPEDVDALLTLLEALVLDQSDMPKEDEAGALDDEDMEDDQTAVASLVCMFDVPGTTGAGGVGGDTQEDLESVFGMLMAARKHFGQGGNTRVKYTLPALASATCRLALRLARSGDERWAAKCKKVFRFAHETVTALARCGHANLAFRQFLQCALAVDQLVAGAAEDQRAEAQSTLESLAYEFVSQCFEIYEEHITNSTQQVQLLNQLIGALHAMTVFVEESYDPLATKAAAHSSKLVKKPDQCRAVYTCAHLFWASEEQEGKDRDDKRVLECLQRSLKVASSWETAQNVLLFLEILNRYIFFFEDGTPSVTSDYLNGLIELINTHIAGVNSADAADVDSTAIHSLYRSTMSYIGAKKAAGNELYADVNIGADF